MKSMFLHFAFSPGTHLLPQLFCLFLSHSFLLRVRNFPFVPIAFQTKAELHGPLFDSRNEGFKEMYQVLQELHFSGEFAKDQSNTNMPLAFFTGTGQCLHGKNGV